MATITTFTLTSTNTQSNAPFTFGHAFKKGDVPSGQVALGDSPEFQCRGLTYWDDGSLKHAAISGRVDTVADEGVTITLSNGSDPGGTSLTEADLSALSPNVVVGLSGFSDITLASCIETSALHRTVCSGPVMSNFIYRKAVTGSNHLVVWFDVRVYVGGNIEVFPWLENAYFLVASPANWTGTITVTVNGGGVYSESVDVKHHTRLPLIDGSVFSYWTGTAPELTPKHDPQYLRATRMVPNYGAYSPSETTLNGLIQTYAPNSLASVDSNMGNAGTSASVIPREGALYVTSGGDERAYKAAIVFGLSSGSWSVHYRDESTNEPIKFTDYPNASLNIQDTPVIPTGTGGSNGTASVTHLPSFGYLPFLITGRWWFWEECAFWATRNYLEDNSEYRQYELAIIDSRRGGYANRGAAWGLRTLAETLVLCPTTHSTYAEWKTAWENNTAFYRSTFVDGAEWVSSQGFLGDYAATGESLYPTATSGAYWMGAAWMSAFLVKVMGHTSNLGIPQSAQSLSDHIAVRNHAYKQPITRAGDGSSYNWRRFIVYSYAIGSDATGLPPETWFTGVESYDANKIAFSTSDIAATDGLTLKEHSTDNDLTSAMSSVGYGSFELAGLALAVEHSAAGAADGWNRVTGASNFNSSFDDHFVDDPSFAIVPYSAEAGTVNLTGSNSTQANTSSTGSIVIGELTEGRSYRFDVPLIEAAYHFGNRGLGVLGAEVPSTGTDGASYLYNDLSLPADANYEVRGVIETWPTLGTLTPYEDGSFTYSGPDGTHTFTYRLYVGGVDKGTATETIEVGSVGPTTRNVAGTNSTQVNSSTSGAINIVRNVAGAASTQVNVSTSGAITINYTPQTRNVAGTHTTQINYSTILPAATPGEEKITFSLGRRIARKLTDELSGLDD